jgi:crotonobetainyl-CoA:carnitine CoA-transferase CaiB-like acyl-CoA transferase
MTATPAWRRHSAGLKVIDCATYIAGPAAATVLSDFGADVVKIEQPGEGDPYRALATMPGQPVSDHNYGWLMDAHNKRSLALDLKSGAGRDILYRLVATADVFITNFPQPVRRRLGLGFEDLAMLNSRLIYAALSAYMARRGRRLRRPASTRPLIGRAADSWMSCGRMRLRRRHDRSREWGTIQRQWHCMAPS